MQVYVLCYLILFPKTGSMNRVEFIHSVTEAMKLRDELLEISRLEDPHFYYDGKILSLTWTNSKRLTKALNSLNEYPDGLTDDFEIM